jgi:transposase
VARRARRPLVLAVAADAARPVRPARSPDLTDDQWQRVLPLLPPQRPPRGRPTSDQRRIVAALLWVERTGCSWRRIPPHFGPWHTIYSRYQHWRKTGLWTQILAVLNQPEAQRAAA